MNITNIVGALEVIAGVALIVFVPTNSVAGTLLIGLGLSTLGIRQAVTTSTQGVKGIW